MKIVVSSHVKHNGTDLKIGLPYDMSDEDAEKLIEAGVAEVANDKLQAEPEPVVDPGKIEYDRLMGKKRIALNKIAKSLDIKKPEDKKTKSQLVKAVIKARSGQEPATKKDKDGVGDVPEEEKIQTDEPEAKEITEDDVKDDVKDETEETEEA